MTSVTIILVSVAAANLTILLGGWLAWELKAAAEDRRYEKARRQRLGL